MLSTECFNRPIQIVRAGLMLTACLGILTLTACGSVTHGPPQHRSQTVPMAADQATLTRVELKMGSGQMEIDGGSSNLLDADFDYSDRSLDPIVDYHSTGSRADLSIRQPEGGNNGGEDKWKLRLSDKVGLDVIASLGAGQAKMNLGSLTLRDVEVHMGAGQVDMDLRGQPKQSYDVRVAGGVGQANIRLPKSVGISATASGGIGSINVEGLEQKDGRWINPGHESDPVMIHVSVQGGVGEIRLSAE